MTIRRFFVEPQQFFHNTITIVGDEHNHLKNVLRLTVGTQIIVVCNNEFDYYANITEVGKNSTICEITKKQINTYNPKVKVTVFQALTKKDAMSNLVQKLSELGASEFTLLETTNTTAKDKVNKVDKLQTVANQSTKQCKRSIALKVNETVNVKTMLQQFNNFDLVVFANETETSASLTSLFSGEHNFKNVAIIVGSEGGFTPNEIELIIKGGGKSITLGKRILRVETATIAVSAIVLNYLNELN